MLTIATRGSLLARWQAEHVQRALHAQHTDVETRFEIVRTTGDRITDRPLSEIGDRGLFTRELDAALLDKRADCAVHSLKDIPTVMPEGLAIAAILEREDPRDAWVARDGASTIESIPQGARIGTSSLRRRALLLEHRPDLVPVDVRGNLDTRLDKLSSGEYDALILAFAGLFRLGRGDTVTAKLDTQTWLPAPGQGAIAVVARADDADTHELLKTLHHADTAHAVRAERALLRALEGGCQVPIGALAAVTNAMNDVHEAGGAITLHAVVARPDGTLVLRDAIENSPASPEEIGETLAARLLASGADVILRELRANAQYNLPPVTPP